MGDIMRKKRIRPARRLNYLKGHIIILLFFGIAVFTGVSYVHEQQKLVDQKINSADSARKLDNPERGWYIIGGYQAESGKQKEEILEGFEKACKEIRRTKERLMEYQIQIQKPGAANREIKREDLDIIRSQFEVMKKYGIQAIVRPLYDWNGKAGKEPKKFDTILTHIKQLGVVFGQYEDIILCIEAGLIGPYGEWHNSNYLSTNHKRTIIDTYLRSTPKTMQISIRRPEFYREIFNTNNPAQEESVRKGKDKGRVGFHNDGYLGSKNDLGTYTKWSRKKELDFQNVHNQFLFFGGEATMTSEYGKLFNAIKDMTQTHCTYLNKEHYLPLKEVWKKTLYTGANAADPAYVKKTGYKYIEDHLGYRFVLQISEIQKGVWGGKTFYGQFVVWNSGFGNIIKPKDVSIILTKDKEKIQIPIEIDVRKWKRGLATESYEVKVPKGTSKGIWNVYLSIKSGDIPIQWANEVGYNYSIGGIKLGVISVY